MKLLIARHGNTFNPDQKPVWVGLKNDLPLVASGKMQAEKLAIYLTQVNLIPNQIITSTLKRTIEYGDIIRKKHSLDLNLEQASELDELDYGHWTGLTNEEIESKFGSAELKAWSEQGRWPKNANWSGSETEVKMQIQNLCNKLLVKSDSSNIVLLISSNGIIRYFLDLVPGLFEEHQKQHKLKVKTGSLSVFNYKLGNWNLADWDLLP